MDDPAKLEEGVKDHRVARDISTDDMDRHASSHKNMLIGLRLPDRPKRPKKSKRRSGNKTDTGAGKTSEFSSPAASQSPTETVQTLLGEVDDEKHQPHKVFCQMDLLYNFGTEMQWREYARWVKYEEDVEEGGERWSKPHVASLSLHSLFELRSTVLNGAVLLDVDAYYISQVVDLVVDQLAASKLLEEDLKDEVRRVLLNPHVHAHQKRRRSIMPGSKSFSKQGRDSNASSNRLMVRNQSSIPNMEHMNGDLPESASSAKLNVDFMRKIPDDAQTCNTMVGELDCLKYQVAAFVRLSEARNLGDITEVPLPTRFIFILMGPPGSQGKCIEMGRSMSTIMVDEIYSEVAYKARNRQELLTGIDEFLDQVTVLPPGEWDPKIRIEPPDKVPSQEGRKTQKEPKAPGPHVQATQLEEAESHADPTLVRTGRLFGGLIADVKRKIPWYASDFKDCLHIQCVASTIFLFLATLTPNITFGGLLGVATDQYMGTMECILTAAIVGVAFALFAGQPLNILGSTGPMLVLEMILYNFCHDNHWDYLPLRCWIGLWTTLLILLVVAFDLSALVRYITRFTEESFACLIAVIFIYEAFKKQIHILDHHGINPHSEVLLSHACECFPPNYTVPVEIVNGTENGTTTFSTTLATTTTTMSVALSGFSTDAGYMYSNASNNGTLNMTEEIFHNWTSYSRETCLKLNGTLIGEGCHYMADVFFLSMLLFIGTFAIAMGLVNFKTSGYFPTFVRQTVSDFAVLISIIVMVGLDAAVGINTPKLQVPEKFEPSKPGRAWFISPYSDKNPWWTAVAAVVPAFLALVLIFMDQQITAVIVNRKENKLKKGNGYHLDMLVVAVCIAICSLLGLPWYVAATVSAIAHIMSLKKESECAAPGEKPVFLGCREQRVTALLVGILSGVSVLLTGILKIIPMPVLYGVFLYMGVAALKGMQFIDRILLMFMPAKYQPDLSYLRHVQIKRVHLFTLIQMICLACLWVIKMVKAVSIIFPIMVVGTCFVRKGMDKLFTQYELQWLDDIMPGDDKNAKEDQQKFKDAEQTESLLDENEIDERERMMDLKMSHTKGEKFGYSPIPASDRVNITDEVNRTGIWLQVRRDSAPALENLNKISKRSRSKENGDGTGEKAAFYMGDDTQDIPEETE